jgi:hypothetical protein
MLKYIAKYGFKFRRVFKEINAYSNSKRLREIISSETIHERELETIIENIL